ncbi:hypothetical protein M885DRAFT_546787, partial [Pelagophyceae sp. CCMP2097]
MMPRRARCSGRPWLARTRPRESASPRHRRRKLKWQQRAFFLQRLDGRHVDSGPPAPGWLVANPAGCLGGWGVAPWSAWSLGLRQT